MWREIECPKKTTSSQSYIISINIAYFLAFMLYPNLLLYHMLHNSETKARYYSLSKL